MHAIRSTFEDVKVSIGWPPGLKSTTSRGCGPAPARATPQSDAASGAPCGAAVRARARGNRGPLKSQGEKQACAVGKPQQQQLNRLQDKRDAAVAREQQQMRRMQYAAAAVARASLSGDVPSPTSSFSNRSSIRLTVTAPAQCASTSSGRQCIQPSAAGIMDTVDPLCRDGPEGVARST